MSSSSWIWVRMSPIVQSPFGVWSRVREKECRRDEVRIKGCGNSCHAEGWLARRFRLALSEMLRDCHALHFTPEGGLQASFHFLSLFLPCKYGFTRSQSTHRTVMRLLSRPTWLTRRIPLSRFPQVTHGAVHHTSTKNVTPVEMPRLLVKPGSSNHNSLSSYLEYAARTKLRPDRTVYIGTHYEYTVAEALQRLGFSLIRTGMKNDAGIDLIGHWMLSFMREPMPVIVQCKSRVKTCSPDAIRELEGAFRSVPQEWRNKDVLGLLITNLNSTEGLRRQMYLSPRPLAFLQITKSGTITQFVWNRAATDRGLEGVGVTSRYTVLPPERDETDAATAIYEPGERPRDENGRFIPDPYSKLRKKGASRTVAVDIQLTWMGTPMFPDSAQVARETAKRLADITRSEREKSAQPKRKPGPVPKPKTALATTVKTHGRSLGAKSKVKAKVKLIAVTAVVPKRGRDRPPKALKEKDVCGDDGNLAKPIPPKGRPGRKPKQMSKKSDGIRDVTVDPVTPRKRGRPRKIVAVVDG